MWPNDAIWRYWPGSILARVMACSQAGPNHYLIQCWFINGVQRNFPRYQFVTWVRKVRLWNYFWSPVCTGISIVHVRLCYRYKEKGMERSGESFRKSRQCYLGVFFLELQCQRGAQPTKIIPEWLPEIVNHEGTYVSFYLKHDITSTYSAINGTIYVSWHHISTFRYAVDVINRCISEPDKGCASTW